MRSVIGFMIAVGLWTLPLMAAEQTRKPPAVAEAHQQTITIKPAANGCSVALSTKVGKALGTPEGLNSATLGETGREAMGSIIACQCGAKVESKEVRKAGAARAAPARRRR